MPLIVLIDTNVWVSATINPRGYPAQLIAHWRDEQFEIDDDLRQALALQGVSAITVRQMLKRLDFAE